MKVRLGLSKDNTWEIPDGLVILESEQAKREFMPFGDELRLDQDDAKDMASLFRHATPVGREYLFQALLRAIERQTTYWKVRSAAIEFIRRQTYQPAIKTLIKVAVTDRLEWLYEVVPVLAALRADVGLAAIAVKKGNPSLTGDVLEEIIWVPTRRAFELMRHSKARKPYIQTVEALEIWGNRVVEASQDKIDLLTKSAEKKRVFPEQFKESLDLNENAQIAWNAGFGYWNALIEGKRPHVLDFTQGIVDARDGLLKIREKLNPEKQFDEIAEIDKILQEVINQVDWIRRLFGDI